MEWQNASLSFCTLRIGWTNRPNSVRSVDFKPLKPGPSLQTNCKQAKIKCLLSLAATLVCVVAY